MTPQLRRTATTIAALALAAVATPVSTAHAAGIHWKTLASISGAKVQACKVPVTSEGPWKIKLRVDATKASGRVSGTAFVTKKDEATNELWQSGWVSPGHISSVGKIKLPAGDSYAMGAGIGTGAMGNGGSFDAGNLPRC
jgi:hypothetical protein